MSDAILYKFRLYVADDATNSAQALINLNALCRKYLPGRHEIEIVDVFHNPIQAMVDGVFLTPTLVRLLPAPKRTLVGSLNQTEVVLQALGLEPITP